MQVAMKPRRFAPRLVQAVVACLLPPCCGMLSAHPSAGQEGAASSSFPDRRVGTKYEPMSLDSRLLLNRMSIMGHRTIDVMLLLDQHEFASGLAAIQRLGGIARRTDSAIGYARVDIPIEHITRLLALKYLQAYLVGGKLGQRGWDRDTPPEFTERIFRDREVSPVVPLEKPVKGQELPLLPSSRAKEQGYNAEEETGLGSWLSHHATFDGRGTTIALVGESAQPDFGHAIFGSALTLEGQQVPKLAGIVNGVAPDFADLTRVELDETLTVSKTLSYRIGTQTYTLPRPGNFCFGLFNVNAGANLVQRFGVIRDNMTQEIWVDTDGDRDFRNEKVMADVERRPDVGRLKVTQPRRAEIAFVVGHGRSPRSVHIYLGRYAHQTLTYSVAAGSHNAEDLAYGVAPAARVVFTRSGSGSEARTAEFFEGYLEVASRGDVDVMSDSAGLRLSTDSAREFTGVFFDRLLAHYGKPIVSSAGNASKQFMATRSSASILTVGGSLGPATFAAMYGGMTLTHPIVHPWTSSGPAFDGALKPDVLAPMNRITADTCGDRSDNLPLNAPQWRLPSCYMMGGGTSSSSPYAGGVLALLISAAKQEGIPYTAGSLMRALRFSAQYLPDEPSFEQGNGIIDINAAWELLKKQFDDPKITSSAPNVQSRAIYTRAGSRGLGLFERDGWFVGVSDRRQMILRREAGGSQARAYRLSWTGNDDTFRTLESIELPLAKDVAIPIDIQIRTPGVHSAILNVHDAVSGDLVYRTQATIIAPERFRSGDNTLRISNTIKPLTARNHFINVPEATVALHITIEVRSGALEMQFVPSHGLADAYEQHRNRMPRWIEQTAGKGRYTVTFPRPVSGNFNILISNHSLVHEQHRARATSEDSEYVITATLLQATLTAQPQSDGTTTLQMQKLTATIRDPQPESSAGTRRIRHGKLPTTGLPQLFETIVPRGTTSLRLTARVDAKTRTGIELYLYDCTLDDCFSHDFTIPAAANQQIIVRKPRPGRWIAAVNAAPAFGATGGFVLDEILTTETTRRPLTQGGKWLSGTKRAEIIEARRDAPGATQAKSVAPASSVSPSDTERVALYDIVDAAAERDELEAPGISQADLEKLATRPVALGTAIIRLPDRH